jgi:hypothetical protein
MERDTLKNENVMGYLQNKEVIYKIFYTYNRALK